MGWNVYNQAAYNQAAYNQAAFNQAAFNQSAHNQAAFNQAAFNQSAHNQAAFNQAAYNQAATVQVVPGVTGMQPMPHLARTGAGMPSGAGFLGGYGDVARCDYATPVDLGPLPWTLDFSVSDGMWSGFPVEQRINPYSFDPPLQWTTGQWDPGLRFWTLDFDPQLTEWLQDLNLASPAVMVAREFATHWPQWMACDAGSESPIQTVLDSAPDDLLAWRALALKDYGKAWQAIERELIELDDLMQEDRLRYMGEAAAQSTSISTYFMHFVGIDAASKPWTVELMNCASAVGNLMKMQYKAHYKRVRPSMLCAGLTPPWGPPQHPAFPSGHSMIAHLTAMALLSIEPLAKRLGLFMAQGGASQAVGRAPTWADFNATRYGEDMKSPMLWLAWRVAKNRERLGVHYPSDSAASRRLAAATWLALTAPADAGPGVQISLPSLNKVLVKAQAEWA